MIFGTLCLIIRSRSVLLVCEPGSAIPAKDSRTNAPAFVFNAFQDNVCCQSPDQRVNPSSDQASSAHIFRTRGVPIQSACLC